MKLNLISSEQIISIHIEIVILFLLNFIEFYKVLNAMYFIIELFWIAQNERVFHI